jgi:hypothetical protein
MATLIPALGRMRLAHDQRRARLAERLEHKLDDDYLLWYDVPMGPTNGHPDFVRDAPAPRHADAGGQGLEA